MARTGRFVCALVVLSSLSLGIPVAQAQNAPSNQTSPVTPVAAPSTTVVVGTGDAKLGALLQFWGLNDSTTTLPSNNTNYRLRRAEVKLTGSVAPETRWFVMFDPAKSLSTGAIVATNDNRILQDLGLAFTLLPDLEITVGQFKTPTTAEGLDSSAELPLPERSYVGRTYGDRREPGLMLTYKISAVKLSLMSSNGNGTNVNDNTNEKDLHFRTDVTLSDDLKFGAFTTAGDSSYNNKKARWGVNARLGLGPLMFRAEGVRAVDNEIWVTGWATDLAYKMSDYFQAVIRWDGVDNSATNMTSTNAALGLNYLIAKSNAKIQASYGVLNNMTGNNGTYGTSLGTNGSVFILAFQNAL